MYRTTRWKRKRKQILRRDKYLCQYYKRFGKRIDADTVHHIYPVGQYPEYAYCNWNLISLSGEAHNAMHDRITHELTGEGKRLQEKTSPPHNVAFGEGRRNRSG